MSGDALSQMSFGRCLATFLFFSLSRSCHESLAFSPKEIRCIGCFLSFLFPLVWFVLWIDLIYTFE
jgi:hypothetical protein